MITRVDAAAIAADAASAAAWLARRGVRTGDRVAVAGANDPRLLALTLGALRTGIVPVVVNPSLPDPERAYVLANCRPSLVVSSLDEICFDEGFADLTPLPLGRPMLYTSGTTGTPKGVWPGVLSDADARAWAGDEHDLWRPDGCVLVCSPLYHSAGHRLAVAALNAGHDVLLCDRFDAAEVVEALRTFIVASTFLVPTHLRRIFALGDPPPPRGLGRMLHAGEPCPPSLKRRALEWIPSLWEFYGSTEGQFSAISPAEWLERPGSVGRARAGRTLRLRDTGADGVGTVYVSAPPFAHWEYFGDEQRTAAAWDGDAFTVGDLGRIDADGFLTLASRREDLILSGGVNVYPAMIEAALLEHPDVREAAALGVADPEWGQRVVLAVAADAGADEVAAFARDRLSGPMRPKQVFVLDALPRTPTGKVDRAAIRAALH